MQAPVPIASTLPEPVLLREDAGGITVLTLNRPERRNSLSDALLVALTEAFSAIARDSSVRAVVLAANGPVFCAGHDLKEMTAGRADADGGRAYFAKVMAACGAMMQAITALPQPVIAAVQGVATAAGCQLVATCDLAVASSVVKFCTPGVDIGLFCSTPMVALSRNVAAKHAMEMLLTAEMVSAENAHRIGLVNRVVAPGAERAEALAFARRIASKSTFAVSTGKQAFYRQREMGLADDGARRGRRHRRLHREAHPAVGRPIVERFGISSLVLLSRIAAVMR
jgi:enoyl-CoA hydratase/carnithine racemase